MRRTLAALAISLLATLAMLVATVPNAHAAQSVYIRTVKTSTSDGRAVLDGRFIFASRTKARFEGNLVKRCPQPNYYALVRFNIRAGPTVDVPYTYTYSRTVTTRHTHWCNEWVWFSKVFQQGIDGQRPDIIRINARVCEKNRSTGGSKDCKSRTYYNPWV